MKCEICGVEESLYTCRLCGRRVCRRDFNSERSICLVCKYTLCQVCSERLAITTCKKCRRLVCEDCAIQVSLNEYLCVECYRSIEG